MKFFERLRKNSTSNNNNNNNDEDLPNSLNYFREQGTLSKMIVDGQRQFLKKIGERQSNWDLPELDMKLNNQFINDQAVKKYGINREDFLLDNSEWFPRVKPQQVRNEGVTDESGRNQSKYGDTESICSDDSDFSHDGFAGPFSWETRSLQEMEFPPTPVGERKLFASPKQHKQKNRRMNSISDLDENSSHRTFETIEELRMRLIQSYSDTKKQREKYLNITSISSKHLCEDKNINGYRSKTQQQPVFRNYKQKTEIAAKTNGIVKFSNQQQKSPTSNNASNDDRFAVELSNALQRTNNARNHHQQPIVIETTYSPRTHRSSSNQSIKSSFKKSSSGVSSESNDDMPYGITNTSGPATPRISADVSSPGRKTPKDDTPTSLSRKNSLKNLMKRSDSRNSMRKESRKSPEITRTDIENVVENQNIIDHQQEEVDSVDDGNKTNPNTGKEQDEALDNVMDMLANW